MIYRVVNNKIENKEGTIINNLGVVYDMQAGCCLKHGDIDNGFLEQYHERLVNKFNESGLEDISEAIILLRFDNDNRLTVDEVCTLSNYLIEVTAIPGILESYLKLSTNDLKDKIKELKELGF